MITGHAATPDKGMVPLSQTSTVPFGFGALTAEVPDGRQQLHGPTQDQSIEVDEEGSPAEPAVPLPSPTTPETIANPGSPLVGRIGDVIEDPPVPSRPMPVPARQGRDKTNSRDSMEEQIPGPVDPVMATHGYTKCRWTSREFGRVRRRVPGVSRRGKPPPTKVPRLESPGFGGSSRKHVANTEFFDLDPVKREDVEDELRGDLAPASVPRPRREREHGTRYEMDTPPWVGALEGRLLAHLEPIKTDVSDINVRHLDMHRKLVHFTSELSNHKVRLDTHDAVLKEHTEKYEAHQIRLVALEREVRDLRSGSRSPTPMRAPPSPRGNSPRSERNIEEELQLALGGREDARRDEAVEETKAVFEALKLENSWQDIWSPYSRTSHVRISLKFPETHISIQQQRGFQKHVLNQLQSRKVLSNIPGQE